MRSRAGVKRINVALQGGGAHGAFAWGVLDGLLADERIEIEAISGTSAGAMNAVVVAEGLVEGGRKQARQQLEEFWQAVSLDALSHPLRSSIWDVLFSGWNLNYNPALTLFEMISTVMSPYQFNPLNINPLRDVLVSEVDFERVRNCATMRLFIAATNVRTGELKVFTGGEVTADAIMASACLPYLFQAVEIDGVPYWDGGYVGNPVISPFLKVCDSQDVLIVQINPISRTLTPRTAQDILDRVNEITFNSSLVKELEHVEFVNDCLRRGDLADLGYREIFLHRIGGGAEFADLTAQSKFNTDWTFLTHLRDLGHTAADRWLTTHFTALGRRSTMDVIDIAPG